MDFANFRQKLLTDGALECVSKRVNCAVDFLQNYCCTNIEETRFNYLKRKKSQEE